MPPVPLGEIGDGREQKKQDYCNICCNNCVHHSIYFASIISKHDYCVDWGWHIMDMSLFAQMPQKQHKPWLDESNSNTSYILPLQPGHCRPQKCQVGSGGHASLACEGKRRRGGVASQEVIIIRDRAIHRRHFVESRLPSLSPPPQLYHSSSQGVCCFCATRDMSIICGPQSTQHPCFEIMLAK